MVYEKFIELLREGHKLALKDVGLTKAEVRKVIREELRSLKFFSVHRGSSRAGPKYERIYSPVFDCVSARLVEEEDFIVIAEGYMDEVPILVGIDRYFNVKWKVVESPYRRITALSYEYDGKMLGAGMRRVDGLHEVFEFDVLNGQFLRRCTAMGILDYIFSVEYSMADPDAMFWVTDNRYHVARRLKWDGTVDWEFGEYGVPGPDDAHLCYPTTVFPARRAEDIVVIGDRNNHRVLWVRLSDKAVVGRFPYPHPTVRFIYPHFWGLIFGDSWWIAPSYNIPNATNTACHIMAYNNVHEIPVLTHLNDLSNSMLNPFRLLLVEGWIGEINWSLMPERLPVSNFLLADGISLTGGVAWGSRPIPAYCRGKVGIFFVSNQPGSYIVQKPRMATLKYELSTGWTGDWDDTPYAGRFEANKLTQAVLYTQCYDAPRLQVTLDADGVLYAWAVLGE